MGDGLLAFLRNLLVEWAFTTNSVTRPSDWYVALLVSGGAEVSSEDANYARQSVAFALASTDGHAENDATVSFAAAESGADYEVHGFAIFDASTGGSKLAESSLEFTKSVTGGQVVSFSAGDLIVGVNE